MIHILVVEDDEKLNRAVCTYLRANGCEGFEIKTVRGLGYKAVVE